MWDFAQPELTPDLFTLPKPSALAGLALHAGLVGCGGIVLSPRSWAGALCLVADLWKFLGFISHPVISN